LGIVSSWTPAPNTPRNTLLISNTTFHEGTGDNMILGQLICKTGAVNAIRNTHNQDELGVCDPRSLLDFEKVNIMNASEVRHVRHYWDVVFNKETLPMGYKFKKQNNYTQTIYTNKQKEAEMVHNLNLITKYSYRLKKITHPTFVGEGF